MNCLCFLSPTGCENFHWHGPDPCESPKQRLIKWDHIYIAIEAILIKLYFVPCWQVTLPDGIDPSDVNVNVRNIFHSDVCLLLTVVTAMSPTSKQRFTQTWKCSHPHADLKISGSFLVSETFPELHRKTVLQDLPKLGTCFKNINNHKLEFNKKNPKKHLVWCNPSLQNPRDPKLTLKDAKDRRVCMRWSLCTHVK